MNIDFDVVEHVFAPCDTLASQQSKETLELSISKLSDTINDCESEIHKCLMNIAIGRLSTIYANKCKEESK